MLFCDCLAYSSMCKYSENEEWNIKLLYFKILCCTIMLTILCGCCLGCAQKEYQVVIQNEQAKEDFYEYVNHDFLSMITLGTQNVQWTWFGELDAATHLQMKQLLSEAKEDPQAKKDDAIQKILDLDACMLDWEAREREGFWKLEDNLKALEQCKTTQEYLDCLAVTYSEFGLASLVGGYSVDVDRLDSSSYSVYLLEADTLLGREYYENAQMQTLTDRYGVYIAQMLMQYGLEQEDALQKAQDINSFIKELSMHSLYREEYQNPRLSYHRCTKEALKKLYSNLDVERMLEIAGLLQVDTFIVRDIAQAKWVNAMFTQENLETLKWYSIFVALHDMAKYGPKAYADYAMEMENVLYGTDNQIEDEDERLYLEEQLLPWSFAKLYTKYFCDSCEIEQVEALVEDIKDSYLEILQHQKWMSRETKAKAQTKLKKMGTKIGFPQDITRMQEMQVIPKSQGGTLMKNVLQYMKDSLQSQRAKIGRSVDQSVWSMTPQTVNAYYSPSNNEIVFPAAILQPPFFSKEYSYGKNLGGIGFIIAHEMSHAFDSNGSMYDEYGNVSDWWTKAERETYDALGEDIIAYYETYDVVGIPINGELTLAENIADLGAMSCITNILKDKEEQLLQAFFQYAYIWAAKTSIQYQTYLLHSDCHAPNKIRVNTVLSSCEDFYRLFGVKAGDGMYQAKRVGIWQ